MQRKDLVPRNGGSAAFEERLAALRVKTGLCESRVLEFTCAVSGRGFSVRFTRVNPAHRFQVAPDSADTPSASADAPAAAAQKEFDASEFDFAGFRCAGCGADSFVICGCGFNICQGRTRRLQDDDWLFVCHDRCGRSALLGGPAVTVRGDGGAAFDACGRRLLPGRGNAALPAPGRKLPPPRK